MVHGLVARFTEVAWMARRGVHRIERVAEVFDCSI